MNIGITCKRAVDYISKKEEGRLSLWQRVQLWRHLAVCSLCRTFSKQNNTIGAMFSRQGEHHHLTEDEKNQMINNVLGEK